MKEKTSMSALGAEPTVDAADPRWQLVERVAASPAFQKSTRLRDLLYYLVERSIHDHRTELSEQRIGQAVFGKPADYSPTADSSVRVHIRQLRLKLHEYFDIEGRAESLILEIPKGAYAPVFRPAGAAPLRHLDNPPRPVPASIVPWVLTVFLAGVCVVLWSRGRTPPVRTVPWPLSAIVTPGSRTQIVIADKNFSLLRIMSQRAPSLEDYLKPDFRETFKFSQLTERESRIVKFFGNSLLTSYADVAVATNILQLAGHAGDRISVRSARDIRLRDLQDGNFVFLGSPTSNPWTSYFQSRLNFEEVQHKVGGPKFFRNKRPEPGELESYYGLLATGSTGDDYATIALLAPGVTQGSVLIVQGLTQEGTEAAGLFLADESRRLSESLAARSGGKLPASFEVLLRIRSVAGSPSSTSVVTTRSLTY